MAPNYEFVKQKSKTGDKRTIIILYNEVTKDGMYRNWQQLAMRSQNTKDKLRMQRQHYEENKYI
jgi:hypothetical protein